MKGLLSYSGIAAKIRAMEGKLLTNEQFKVMAALENVPAAVGFLKTLRPYQEIFTNLDGESLHRGTIERLLTDSLYSDYTKLYKFASLKQRQFLDFYFFHFETDILKNCLRNAVAHEPVSLGLAHHEDFFKKHSRVDLVRVSSAENLDEFITYLEGSEYYPVLNQLRESGDSDHFDYEMALDLFYFKKTWKMIAKNLPKSEQANIFEYFGTKLDLLNLQWIYRTKRYYVASTETIQKLLIPLHRNLKTEQINKLIRAETVEDFFTVLEGTWYGSRLKKADFLEKPDLEVLYRFVLNHMHRQGSKKKPYSMTILYSYLYFKEAELRKIITIIESIRYEIDVSEINTYIEQH